LCIDIASSNTYPNAMKEDPRTSSTPNQVGPGPACSKGNSDIFWIPGSSDAKIRSFASHQTIKRKTFLNLINYCHFNNRRVLLHLVGGHDTDILLAAQPHPSSQNQVRCQVPEARLSSFDGNLFLAHIAIDDGKSITVLPTGRIPVRQGLSVAIPVNYTPYRVIRRKAARYTARQIAATVRISDEELKGHLVEFSSAAWRIELEGADLEGIAFHDPVKPRNDVVITLCAEKGTSTLQARCRILRFWRDAERQGLVVEALEDAIPVFNKRKIRNPRISLTPPPVIRFTHPLSGNQVEIEAAEIGSSGFSVAGSPDETVLIPGLVIDRVELSFPGVPPIACSAQVVHRTDCPLGDRQKHRFGFAILDISIEGYTRLMRILQRTFEPCIRISPEFSSQGLWELFFDTDFLYPDKYALVQANREAFRNTHEKVTAGDPDVAKSFVYQKGNTIYAHIGLVRAYEQSWLLHHHSARPADGRLSGLLVLRHAMYFLNDIYRYPSAAMKYAICYFRPQNRFPRYAFGGFAEHLNEPGGCSLYEFAYTLWDKKTHVVCFPDGWWVTPMKENHINYIYARYSDSALRLLLDSMGMGSSPEATMALEGAYAKHGLIRTITRQILCYEDQIAGIVLINRSDPGLNFSDLLNSIHFIALPDAADVITPEAVKTAISIACTRYPQARVPVLYFPARVCPSKKRYAYWALNVAYGDEFMVYMNEKFKL